MKSILAIIVLLATGCSKHGHVTTSIFGDLPETVGRCAIDSPDG